MAKSKKIHILAAFLILLVLVAGCSLRGKKEKKTTEDIRTGTDGITISFLANAPPAKIVAQEGVDSNQNSFDVILDVRNKGAYPQPENRITAPEGRIYLSGYDRNIIYFKDKDVPSEDFSGKPLEGKSTINPNGGQELFTFKGIVNVENLNVEKYEPTLQVTACYQYQTVAGPSVCIDPDPYSTTTQKKVCEVKPITLTSQGAPVAVIKIDEEAFAAKTQFRITIKNVGKGEVFKQSSLEKCSPVGAKVGREDIDKVFVYYVKAGNKDLICGPFVDRGTLPMPGYDIKVTPEVRERAGYVRLINGEGHIICEMQGSDYVSSKAAYTTPLNILLEYAYRNTAEKKILVKREGGTIEGIQSLPPSPPAGEEEFPSG